MIFIFMILVKIETPGKAFYCQERVGLMGEKNHGYQITIHV